MFLVARVPSRSPSALSHPFSGWEGSPTIIDYRRRTLVPTYSNLSNLEDLALLLFSDLFSELREASLSFLRPSGEPSGSFNSRWSVGVAATPNSTHQLSRLFADQDLDSSQLVGSGSIGLPATLAESCGSSSWLLSLPHSEEWNACFPDSLLVT